MINFKSKYSPLIIFSSVFAVVFLLSVILYSTKGYGKKRIFIFPSADSGEFIVEYRYLNSHPVQGDVNLYVDELLLGSGVERTKRLFTPGTRVLSCFQRDNTLYLNLSEDLLNKGTDVIEIKEGTEILSLNIKKNFRNIQNVVIFVGGKLAFESF